jgi:hypothetical protein
MEHATLTRMKRTRLSRREFLPLAAAAGFSARGLWGQASGAHASVAEMEREHILGAAKSYLAAPSTISALVDLSAAVAALTAAYLLTRDEAFAARAMVYLREVVSVQPTMSDRDAIVRLVPLAEVARATSFLADSRSFAAGEQATIQSWLGGLLMFLNSDRNAQLARDSKDHRAAAWLLLAAASARATQNELQLDPLRLRFKRPTLRNQIAADGRFPEEIATPNPYRNSLFTFDLLAGACQLLTTQFDDLWEFELPDGPGMRSVAAFLYPLILDRAKWPFIADADLFRDLPGRRPALLFAGRAYERPEYVELFRKLPATAPPAEIIYSFPIRQPLLWTTRAPHGF